MPGTQTVDANCLWTSFGFEIEVGTQRGQCGNGKLSGQKAEAALPLAEIVGVLQRKVNGLSDQICLSD